MSEPASGRRARGVVNGRVVVWVAGGEVEDGLVDVVRVKRARMARRKGGEAKREGREGERMVPLPLMAGQWGGLRVSQAFVL